MASKDWPRGRGEASRVSNLKITTHYLDLDYEIVEEDLKRGDTRLLRVFSLIPKTLGKPSFHARVDDGSPDTPKDPELDIDIKGVSDTAIIRDFKANRNGYIGHHNSRSASPSERVFDVEISTPKGNVFRGEIFFNVTFSMSIHISARASVTATATVVRANWLKNLRISLAQLWRKLTSSF